MFSLKYATKPSDANHNITQIVVSFMSFTKISLLVNELEYITEFVIVLKLIESVIWSIPTVSETLNEISQLSKLILPEFSI